MRRWKPTPQRARSTIVFARRATARTAARASAGSSGGPSECAYTRRLFHVPDFGRAGDRRQGTTLAGERRTPVTARSTPTGGVNSDAGPRTGTEEALGFLRWWTPPTSCQWRSRSPRPRPPSSRRRSSSATATAGALMIKTTKLIERWDTHQIFATTAVVCGRNVIYTFDGDVCVCEDKGDRNTLKYRPLGHRVQGYGAVSGERIRGSARVHPARSSYAWKDHYDQRSGRHGARPHRSRPSRTPAQHLRAPDGTRTVRPASAARPVPRSCEADHTSPAAAMRSSCRPRIAPFAVRPDIIAHQMQQSRRGVKYTPMPCSSAEENMATSGSE